MSGRVLKTIEWFIDVPDKSSLVGEGQVDSSEFTIVHEESKEDTKWSLRILFQEKRRPKSNHEFGVYLVAQSETVSFDMKCCLIVLDQQNYEDNKLMELSTISGSEWKKDQAKGLRILPRDELYAGAGCRFLKNGKVHVVVVIREDSQSIIKTSNDKTNQSEKYFMMMTTMEPNDIVTLKTSDGTVLRAHKKIIGAKSIVLQKMFDTDMTEKKTKAVNIIDFSGRVMQELLKFICIGKACASEEIMFELYEAAKAYQVDSLMVFCASAIESSIETSNVFKIAEHAALHEETKLFDSCCNFIGNIFYGPFLRKRMKEVSIETQTEILFHLYSKIRAISDLFWRVETKSN